MRGIVWNLHVQGKSISKEQLIGGQPKSALGHSPELAEAGQESLILKPPAIHGGPGPLVPRCSRPSPAPAAAAQTGGGSGEGRESAVPPLPAVPSIMRESRGRRGTGFFFPSLFNLPFDLARWKGLGCFKIPICKSVIAPIYNPQLGHRRSR